jgi:hypothetical protein
MPEGSETLVCVQEERSAREAPAEGRPHARSGVIYGCAIFLGAYLLFQVELILGKLVLPWFGGTPAVWTACLLVFQVLLLAGYAYARLFAFRLSARNQGLVHLGVLGSSLLLLIFLAFLWPAPITPSATWRPHGTENATWFIVRFLLAGIGLPFLVLASTGPLLQHWFAQESPGRPPYRLYALSNLGSLLGLLVYPLLLEPFLRLHTQAWIWTASYAIFLGLCGRCARRVSLIRKGDHTSPLVGEATPAPKISQYLLWTALAACASVFLLATTNMICQDVAVIPFLWVLPLSLYLISFILCFENERWYRRDVFHALFVLTVCFAGAYRMPRSGAAHLVGLLISYSALLFTGCMVCHGEVARLKPVARYLTSFYLSIALGGALGGVFVSIAAPRIFSDYRELILAVIACCALLLGSAVSNRGSWWYRGRRWMGFAGLVALILSLPIVLQLLRANSIAISDPSRYAAAGAAAAIALVVFFADRSRPNEKSDLVWVRAVALTLLALASAEWLLPLMRPSLDLAQRRNFYGVLSLREIQPDNVLRLVHGQTIHGYQSLDPTLRRVPIMYYGYQSGVGILMRNLPAGPHHVGLIGLGTGSLAAFGHPGDYFRFYEINPEEIPWSAGDHPYFTYIRDSAARVDVLLGDARLSLEAEAAAGELQRFDVLVLDAFSGDAIPAHLLTREAFEIYLKHLKGPQSVIAAHITNRVLNLEPVLAGIAQSLNLKGVHIYRPWMTDQSATSDWVLLSGDPAWLSAPEIVGAGKPLVARQSLPLWTDDYSNLLRVLR